MKKEDKDAMHTMCLLFKALRAQSCKGDYQKALESYQEIIKSGQDCVDAFWGVGFCQYMLGNQDAAETAAKKAIEINPNHFRSLQLMASIYAAQEKEELSYEYVIRALSNIPRTVAENSPRLANFTRKVARFIYSGNPDDYVEEMLGLEEEDRIWISWAQEFKKEYESKAQNKGIHTDAE